MAKKVISLVTSAGTQSRCHDSREFIIRDISGSVRLLKYECLLLSPRVFGEVRSVWSAVGALWYANLHQAYYLEPNSRSQTRSRLAFTSLVHSLFLQEGIIFYMSLFDSV